MIANDQIEGVTTLGYHTFLTEYSKKTKMKDHYIICSG